MNLQELKKQEQILQDSRREITANRDQAQRDLNAVNTELDVIRRQIIKALEERELAMDNASGY